MGTIEWEVTPGETATSRQRVVLQKRKGKETKPEKENTNNGLSGREGHTFQKEKRCGHKIRYSFARRNSLCSSSGNKQGGEINLHIIIKVGGSNLPRVPYLSGSWYKTHNSWEKEMGFGMFQEKELSYEPFQRGE